MPHQSANIFIFLLAFTIVFVNLGGAYLFDVDEAVFAQASKEMLLSGDWINPTYNGVNRYDKPILIYWLMVLSYKVFGVNEFAARLPSAISALLLAFVLFVFVKRHLPLEKAQLSLLCLVVSPYYFIYSRAAVTDMTLTLFVTLSLMSFYSGLSLRHTLGFHLFSALAFLTKGLIGLVFPFGIALSFIAVSKQWQRLKTVFDPVGLILLFAVSAPWYIAQYQRNGMEFIEQFFFKHHFQRYTDVISGHYGPFYYYLIALCVGLLPWSLLLPLAIKRAWTEKKIDLNAFALIWSAFVVVFFSFSTTKLPNYILPSIPAVAIQLSHGVDVFSKRWFKSTLILSTLLFTTLVAAAPNYLQSLNVTDAAWLYWIIPINLITLTFIFLSNRASFSGLLPYGIALTMTMLFILIALKGIPMVADRAQGTLHKFSIYAKEALKEDERIFVYRINQPSILFYSDRRLIRAGSIEEAERILQQNRFKIGITKGKFTEDMLRLGFKPKEISNDYGLFER